MSKNTIVRCDVENCRHNKDMECTLNILNITSVLVGECNNRTETICEMFKKD